MTTLTSDVAIVGGGHAGLLVAAALDTQALSCSLIEPRPLDPDAQPGGRGLALMAGSRDLIDKMGVWQFLADQGQPIRATKVRDQSGQGWVDYQSADMGGRIFGYGFDTERLRALLASAVLNHTKVKICATGLVELIRERSSCTLKLGDGSTVRASLIIGADGRGSTLRRLANIAISATKYAQTAVTFMVQHDQPTDSTVREHMGPAGPLALLPLGAHHTSVTWVEKPERSHYLCGLEANELLDELVNIIGEPLGPMHLASRVVSYPLGAQHASRYVAPRLALVGDAAHGVHPIHAQGFNMGVGDISKLVDLVGQAARNDKDIGGADLLRAYERERWWDNQTRLWLTDGLNRIFSNDLKPIVKVRGGVLSFVRNNAHLRRKIMRQGMQLA